MGIRGSAPLPTPSRSRRAHPRGRLLGALLAVALVASPLTSVGPARAAFPGANGKIAFWGSGDGDGEIFVMKPDGSAQTQLTFNTGDLAGDATPVWSPDGTKIAFVSNRDGDHEIFVMNADGSAQTQVTLNEYMEILPAWSPDGTKIAFVSNRRGLPQIFVMNADGSAQTQVTHSTDASNTSPAINTFPAWSPDGTKIAFMSDRDGDNEIFVMNPDGSAQTQLTFNTAADFRPAWSPDAGKIAFVSNRDGDYEIFVMNPNGTAHTQLTTQSTFESFPAWSPDGTKIAFTSGQNEFGDGNEIFVMNADGSGQRQLTFNTTDDFQPDWQPLVGVDPDRGASSTSLKVIKKERRVVAKGQVSPDHPGERVVAKLFKKKGGRFVLLAKKRPVLDSSSRYAAHFRRPGQGRCLVKVRFAGDDDHLASAARQKFRC